MSDEPFRNPALTVDERVADLLARMTIAEKVGQVNQRMFGWNATEPSAGGGFQLTDAFRDEVARWDGMGALYGLFRADPWSGRDLATGVSAEQSAQVADSVQRWVCENTRLGIPVLFVEEVPHGHQAIDGTILPVNLAVGSSWDPDAYAHAAARMAAEVRARGAHVALVSALDMLVDPRWGRSEECFGEDPYLAAALTQALVHGMQGANEADRIGPDKLAVVLKHFAGQGAAIGGLNAHAAPIGQRELREIHLPAAEAGIRAGAAGVMAAYNEIDGVPCAGNADLLTGILRQDWGFDGIVMADGGGIDRLTMMTGDLRAAAVLALNAGIDLSLWDRAYTQLESAYDEGLFDVGLLDRAVARVLRLKFRLGLFDRPYARPDAVRPPQRDVSLRLAERSLVLLRNEKSLLPLPKTTRRIAVIGPHADGLVHQIGDYTAEQPAGTGATVLNGIRAAAADGTLVRHEPGCGLTTATPGGIERARQLAAESDVVVLVLGGSSARRPTTRFADNGAAIVDENVDMTCGEGVDLAELTLPHPQLELARTVAATGTPVAAVLIQGRPHALADLPELAGAILCAWYPGTEGGTAIASALFGDVNPGGRLPVSIPTSAAVLPVAYNAKAHSHTTYVDVRERVRYPFGFGLGYTTFEYGAAELSRDEISADDLRSGATVDVRLRITNAGTVSGSEVVQLYTRRTASSVWPRERELKAFQRVDLDPGRHADLRFELGERELGWWLPGMRFGVEPSRQRITVAGAPGDPLELTIG